MFRIPNAVNTDVFSPLESTEAEAMAGGADTIASPDFSQGPKKNQNFPTAEEKENKRQRPVRIMYASAIQAQKGIYTLLHAAQILKENNIPVVWDVYGDGPAADDVKMFCTTNALEDVVTLHGVVCRDEMPDRFREADVVTLPSYNEPFATVFLEAMACGKPCIGAGAGGTPEIIREGETGFIIPFGDAAQLADRVRVLAEDARMRERMGRAGREKVMKAYTWKAVTERIEEAYERLLRV